MGSISQSYDLIQYDDIIYPCMCKFLCFAKGNIDTGLARKDETTLVIGVITISVG